MPTDGADYPKRRKNYGRAYKIAESGTLTDTIDCGVAGIARDLSSEPIPKLSEALSATVDHSHGLFRNDPYALFRELNRIVGQCSSENQILLFQSLPKIAGELIIKGAYVSEENLLDGLARAFVQQKLINNDLASHFAESQPEREISANEAEVEFHSHGGSKVKAILQSCAESKSGRPKSHFKTPGKSLPKIDALSPESLTSTPLN